MEFEKTYDQHGSNQPSRQADETSSSTNQLNGEVERGAITPLEKPRTITGIKWFLFIVSTLTGMFLYGLDNTIVANIQPAVVNHFNAVEQLPWLSVGFMVGGVAMVMPLGKLYALYDAKWLFIISTVIFMASSALCGAAPTMAAEIVGRVFAGVGGNGMYLGLLGLISVNTTNKERPAYLSLTGLIWGVGTILGPVIGGAFELYTWRWAFYINLLFGAFLLPAYAFLIPSSSPTTGISIGKRASTFDVVGALLSIAAFTVLIVAINFGGGLYAWKNGAIIAFFVVGGLLWIAFAIQQSFSIFTSPENRMFPVHLLKMGDPVLLFVINCCVGTISYVDVYYIPLYFQFTQGDSAIQAAIRLLPFIFLLITFMLGSGFFMSRFGLFTPWYLGGSALALVGAVLMSRVDISTSTSAIYGFEALLGIGAGAYTQASFAVIQAILDPRDAGAGVILMLIAQLCGLAFGLSVAGAVFINLAEHGLRDLLPNTPLGEIRQVISGTSGRLLTSLSPALKEKALEVIVAAWQKVFIHIYTAAAISLVLSIFLSHKRASMPQIAGGG